MYFLLFACKNSFKILIFNITCNRESVMSVSIEMQFSIVAFETFVYTTTSHYYDVICTLTN